MQFRGSSLLFKESVCMERNNEGIINTTELITFDQGRLEVTWNGRQNFESTIGR